MYTIQLILMMREHLFIKFIFTNFMETQIKLLFLILRQTFYEIYESDKVWNCIP